MNKSDLKKIKVDPKSGLTEEETKVFELISYKLLKSDEPIKAMDNIHLIQGIFMQRIAIRNYEIWSYYPDEPSYENVKLKEITPKKEYEEEYQKLLNFYKEFLTLPVYHTSYQDDVRRGLNELFTIIEEKGKVSMWVEDGSDWEEDIDQKFSQQVIKKLSNN